MPIGDAASGVDWSKTTNSAVVTGGILSSAVQQDGKASISVTSMNQPTSTHQFEAVDSKAPTMGGWEIDGTLVASGVLILTDSATFGMTITADVPTLGITSVVASLDGGSGTAATRGNHNRFTVAYSGLSDGTHSLRFAATDGSGNSSASALSFTVDAVAPGSGLLGYSFEIWTMANQTPKETNPSPWDALGGTRGFAHLGSEARQQERHSGGLQGKWEKLGVDFVDAFSAMCR